MKLYIYIYLGFLLCLMSCSVSFKGVAIDPEIKTFNVKLFKSNATNAPQTLAQNFTESLKNKIRSNSRLILNGDNYDVDYSGVVREFSIQSVAPKPNEKTSYNQLRITISVEYNDSKNEKKNWKQDFSYQQDFPSNESLLSIQDRLIKTIFDQLVEDIFNKSFTDW